MTVELREMHDWIAEHRADLTKGLRECTDQSVQLMMSIVPDVMTKLWDVGCWLKVKLVAMGCDEKIATDICFALGQRSLFEDGETVAISYANEFERTLTVADKPGEKLAMQLCEEHIGVNANADQAHV